MGFLDGLDQAIRQGERANETLLVVGDFNAKSRYWGSSIDDGKGEALESFAASLGLWTNNVGTNPTFHRGASTSIIDVTFSGPGPFEVVDWEVLDEYSGSDQNYIAFNLTTHLQALNDGVPMRRGDHLGWASRKLDSAALSRKLDEGPPLLEEPASADDAAEVLNDYLANACDACMPRRAYGVHKRKSVHWWNQGIADRRAECIRKRRIYLRVVKRQGPDGSTAERIAFREARKALRVSIRKSQKLSWAALCASVDNDPWGVPYKIVSGRLSRQPPGIAAIGREIEIADNLFPPMPIINWQLVPLEGQVDPTFPTTTADGYNINPGYDCPPVTTKEIGLAVSRLLRGDS
ncbi:Endonuclease/exonuclease/phosphatase [Cinara cedri]|uniref:Endonuclease/exonuclease/phosphatase n=1 Tax=Cinara cedri TaxID=506608 RepID=A0A5E4MWM9_9HEMI|nr:Endonuclease/exonuclease/phosphatase [Cinara cedri]